MLLKVYREELLLRIMTNLLDNSRKYRNKDIGHCVVSVSREENRARIEFAGNGPGVDDECLGKLFDIFYRTVPHGQSAEQHRHGLGNRARVRAKGGHPPDGQALFSRIPRHNRHSYRRDRHDNPVRQLCFGHKELCCRYNLSRSRNSGRSFADRFNRKFDSDKD